ncbi:MAG: hypothetical protein ACR2QK_04045, partial [Acidimicrobiales bacterium]
MLQSGVRRLGLPANSSWGDLAYTVGFFGCYFAADLSTRRLAGLHTSEVDGPSLLLDAVRANVLAAFVVVALLVGLAARSRSRLL